MSLESIDDIEGGDSLSLGVFSVGDWVSDDVLEEGLEDSSGLIIDEGADSLDTTSSGESADSGLGDAHDGLSDGLLGSSLGSVFASLSFSSFVGATCKWEEVCLKSLGSVEAMDNFGIGVSDAWRALEQKQSQIVTIPRFYMRNEYSLPAKEGMLFSSLLQEDTEWNEWVQQNQEDTKGAAESTMNDDDEDNEEEMSLGMDSIFA